MRLYLNWTICPYRPAGFQGGWDQTTGAGLDSREAELAPYKYGSNNIGNTSSETVTTSPYRVAVMRCMSLPLAPQTLSGDVDFVVGVQENHADADLFTRFHLYVVKQSDDSVLGTLISQYEEGGGVGTEWSTTLTGRALDSPQGMTPVVVPNDGETYRLVLELGFRANNNVVTVGAGVTPNGTYRVGTIGVSTLDDLVVGDTGATVVARAGYIDFTSDVLFASVDTDAEPAGEPILPTQIGANVEIDFYSDIDMQCPASWYGGYKQARLTKLGVAERTASHPWTGEWEGSSFNFQLSDYDKSLRQNMRSQTNRFWVDPVCCRMTTRANRADLGRPFTVFVGTVMEATPAAPLLFDVTLSDIVAQSLLSDEHQVPWRKIGDGFLSQLDNISEHLDREQPEPIIYGEHRRTPDDPPSHHGFQFKPIYLGRQTVGSVGTVYHVWLVAGHACYDLPEVLVWTPDPDEEGLGTAVSKIGNVNWLIPHDSAPAYEDLRSDTYGNDRRYTLIRGLEGDTDADACALGEKTLTVFVDGVEDVGDGSGDLIQDRLLQYKHFAINFVANYGAASYQSGDWLSNPTWDLFDVSVPIVLESSFDACAAIAEERLPAVDSGSPVPPGYIGAGIIGASSGDRSSVRRWIADWNRSCGVQFVPTHLGQLKVFMLHPTLAIKAAATLYLDAYEILDGSFGTSVRWGEMANRIPFQTDYDHTAGVWRTVDVAEAGDAIQNYGRAIQGELREYLFAPGITMAFHLARLESLVRKHPPRVVRLEASVGHHYVNESLGYAEVGDYIKYQSFDQVGSPSEIRLAQITKQWIDVGERKVGVECFDCEELIDYDAPPEEPEVLMNDSCETAIEVFQEPFTPLAWHIDTTNHQRDTTVEGGSPSLLPAPGEAHHAAWWKWTAPANGTLFLTTVHSEYDTVMAVLTGVCGTGSPTGWTLEQWNDNDPVFLMTSVLEFPVTMGVEYYILVYGYGPNDGGDLTFGFYFTEPE